MSDFVYDPSVAQKAVRTAADDRRAVAVWLWCVAALVLLMVVVGGVTRLTESGLSITEWKPVTGVFPPLTAEAWAVEFEKYKQIPQYTKLFPDMDLSGFKFIFFWEWTHRLLGRLLGVAFAGPMIYFWVRGQLTGLKLRLAAVLALGGLQGAVGWWMVTSGLTGRVEVAQERLATHLVLASVTFAALVWLAASVAAPQNTVAGRRGLRGLATAILVCVLVQIGLGGLVAGARAGLTYNTWPLMDGRLVPPLGDLTLLEPLWRNVVDNVATIQFDHRLLAYGLLALALAQVLVAGRGRGARNAAILAGFVTLQAVIGITTLVLVVPLWAGLLHQTFAMIVLGMAVINRRALSA